MTVVELNGKRETECWELNLQYGRTKWFNQMVMSELKR